jgi:hypothetical protein
MRLPTHQLIKLFSIIIVLGDLSADIWADVSWSCISASETYCSTRSLGFYCPGTIWLPLFLLPPLYVTAAIAVLTNGARAAMACQPWSQTLAYQCPSPAVGWSVRKLITQQSKRCRKQEDLEGTKSNGKGTLPFACFSEPAVVLHLSLAACQPHMRIVTCCGRYLDSLGSGQQLDRESRPYSVEFC